MISASLSLSLPRLGWKSTSTPRSLKICTAAGDSASEMRTLGMVFLPSPSPGGGGSARRAGGGVKPRKRNTAVAVGDDVTPPRHASHGDPPPPGEGERVLRRLGERGFRLGEGPVEPRRQRLDIRRFDRGAAPDAQARRRIAVMAEVVARVFLLDEGDERLGEGQLLIRRQFR